LRERLGCGEIGEAFRRRLEVTKGVSTGRGSGLARSEPRTVRLREYLQVVQGYADRSVATVSSHHLARCVGVRASLVRRDLSELGHLGTPGRGYSVSAVGTALRESLSLGPRRSAVWLGAARQAANKHVAEALAMVNCALVGVFDDNSEARQVAGISVRPLAEAEEAAKTATVAVLASEAVAQPEVLRGLAEAGIEAILNLTSVRLDAAANIVVEQADLGSQLLRLFSRLAPPEKDASSETEDGNGDHRRG
jgi:redox-sensing transcriptional repressor